MKSIEHYEQLAREAKGEDTGRRQMTFRDLRETLDALMTSVGDDEIEGMTMEQLDCMPVVVRIVTAEGCEVGALTSADVDGGCADGEALMLDGEFDAQPALGPSNDETISVVEIHLAEVLAETYCEPHDEQEMERWVDCVIDSALIAREFHPPVLNHDAEQAETGGEG